MKLLHVQVPGNLKRAIADEPGVRAVQFGFLFMDHCLKKSPPKTDKINKPKIENRLE